jgi:hypothetical protein
MSHISVSLHFLPNIVLSLQDIHHQELNDDFKEKYIFIEFIFANHQKQLNFN